MKIGCILFGSDVLYDFVFRHDVPLVTAPIRVEVQTRNKSGDVQVGEWNPVDRFVQAPTYTQKKIRRFFRIGEIIQPFLP